MVSQIEIIRNLIAQGNYAAGLKACEELLQIHPHDVDALIFFATCLIKQHKIEQALVQLKLAHKLKPNDPSIHNNLANLYKIQGNFDLALTHLYESLRLAPTIAETYNNLANIEYRLGQLSQAIEHYEKALRLNPHIFEAHYNLANAFVRAEHLTSAIKHYKLFLNRSPKHSQAQINLAMVYIQEREYELAIDLIISAMEQGHYPPELHGNLADCYLEIGNDQAALEHYTFVTQQVANANWLHNLAILHLRLGEREKAQTLFSQSLALEPNNPTASYMLNALTQNQNIITPPVGYIQDLFDQYASYYNTHMKNDLSYDLPTQMRHLIQTRQLNNVLDLGCGTGLCGVVFRDISLNLIGVDLSRQMLAHAQALDGYDLLVQANIQDCLPLIGPQYFDIILAAEVLAYIGDLSQLFPAIYQALKPGGCFIFSIELSPTPSYTLSPTGRFTHHPAYIEELAQHNNFVLEYSAPTILRHNNASQVKGQIIKLIVPI